VNESALIPYRREVGALGSFFYVLLLLNLELVDTNQVVMLKRQLNGLFKRDMSWGRGRIGLAGRCKRAPQHQNNNGEHLGFHDFTSFTR
jgi:hypothetical protein